MMSWRYRDAVLNNSDFKCFLKVWAADKWKRSVAELSALYYYIDHNFLSFSIYNKAWRSLPTQLTRHWPTGSTVADKLPTSADSGVSPPFAEYRGPCLAEVITWNQKTVYGLRRWYETWNSRPTYSRGIGSSRLRPTRASHSQAARSKYRSRPHIFAIRPIQFDDEG